MVKKKLVSVTAQRTAADILTMLYFCKTMEDVSKLCKDIYERYELNDDPFTNLPCSDKDYAKNCLEYERQSMMERYGHCDGFD